MLVQPIVIIGQAPNRSNDWRHPLEGRVGLRLCQLFGCSTADYLSHTQRRNVLLRWPGKSGKGDHFPHTVAMRRAKRMKRSLGGRHVLFVGIATARVFGITSEPFHWQVHSARKYRPGMFWAAVVPHPSGINKWWNLLRNQQHAAIFMRRTWKRLVNARC